VALEVFLDAPAAREDAVNDDSLCAVIHNECNIDTMR
jgi:hypothetical protein